MLWFLLVLMINTIGLIIFRMDIPPATPRDLSDATLFIPAPDSDLAKELGAYLAASDPALFAADRSPRKRLEPTLPGYRPSFDQMEVEPLPLPAPEGRMLPALAGDFGAVIVNDPADAMPYAPPADSPLPATFVRLEGEISGRSWKEAPVLREIAPPDATLLPTIFTVGVTPAGRIRHAILKQGSGNAGADTAALQAVLRSQLNTDAEGSGPAWGMLTIHWAPLPAPLKNP